jgi:AraC-like DNA-binding protein
LPLPPLPSPLPQLFSVLLALAGLVAAARSVHLFRADTPNPHAVRIAAAFLAVAAVHLLESAVAASPLNRLVPHLHSTTFGLAYGFGPALWLTARRAARIPPARAPVWLHFLPVLVGSTSLVSWWRTPAAGKIAFFDFQAIARPPSMEFGAMVAAQALILLGLVYAAAAHRLLRERSRENGTGDEVHEALERLARIAGRGRDVYAAYWLVFLVVQTARWHTFQVEYVPSLIGSATLFLFAGILRKAPAVPESTGRAPRGPGRYRKASLPQDRIPELLSALEQTMTRDRAHLDPGLDLPGLASRLGVTPHQLSQLLNRELGVTFTDYVNCRRVQEARRILDDPAQRDLTVLAVAMEVGFRSKNTFTSAFKKHAGTTPSEYRRS